MTWKDFLAKWKPNEVYKIDKGRVCEMLDECIATIESLKRRLPSNPDRAYTRIRDKAESMYNVFLEEHRKSKRKNWVNEKTWTELNKKEVQEGFSNFDGEIIIRQYTVPVEIEHAGFRYYIGSDWRVYFKVIDYDGEYFLFPSWIDSSDARVTHDNGSSFIHPHIHSHGPACWGDFNDLVVAACRNADYETFDSLFVLYLQEYNADSPTCPIEFWMELKENQDGFIDGSRKVLSEEKESKTQVSTNPTNEVSNREADVPF